MTVLSYCLRPVHYEISEFMLGLCRSCSGFVPDDCLECPHCQTDLRVESSDSSQTSTGHESISLAAAAAAETSPSVAARFMRRVWKGTLIAGSSMVLAACYGSPPDDYVGPGSDDDESATGGSGGERPVSTGGQGGTSLGGLGGAEP